MKLASLNQSSRLGFLLATAFVSACGGSTPPAQAPASPAAATPAAEPLDEGRVDATGADDAEKPGKVGATAGVH
jgi:hypothetical protein